MDAEQTWHVWRRILREEPVRAAALSGQVETMAEPLGLAEADVAVVQAYAQSPAGMTMFADSYRYRMISSFFNALETASPLTRRVLTARGRDLDELAVNVLDAGGWFDHGPFVYTFGGQILDYLAAQAQDEGEHGLTDLIGLERAGVDMIRAAAGAPSSPQARPGRWRAQPWLESYDSATDLSTWLRDPLGCGAEEPPSVARHYVVYLPSSTAARRIVSLPRRAMLLLSALRERPKSVEELQSETGAASAPDGVAADLARLRQLGLAEPPARGR
jgi:hypothetical protein